MDKKYPADSTAAGKKLIKNKNHDPFISTGDSGFHVHPLCTVETREILMAMNKVKQERWLAAIAIILFALALLLLAYYKVTYAH